MSRWRCSSSAPGTAVPIIFRVSRVFVINIVVKPPVTVNNSGNLSDTFMARAGWLREPDDVFDKRARDPVGG